MVLRDVCYAPGLYKIFDEILVNAADNIQRDKKGTTHVKITIDEKKNCIKVWNNGQGVPCKMHAKEKVYVPELIFGHLLTSSNYDDKEKKVTGGRNGFGAKLTNIFSKRFEIECADSSSKKLYKQTFKNNMSVIEEPKITAHDGSSYTVVTFYPDFAKFKMKSFDNDIIRLCKKRAYDLAGISPKTVVVSLNGKKIPIKSFENYVAMYNLGENSLHEKINDRWEVVVAESSTGNFQQVSFVNSICTLRGGSHVSAIADQIVKRCQEVLTKKKKAGLKPAQIKNALFICVNCLVENPAFDS